MKNKTFACVMGLVLALSLTACGEEEVIVENTNEEVSVEVQTQETTEAPTETVAETGTEAEGGPLLQVAVMEIPDLSGTEWNFVGGMIDGVEMEEEDLNATLETYQKYWKAAKSYEHMVKTSGLIYNDSVENYNCMLHRIPDRIAAGICGYHRKKLIEIM